MGDKLGLEMKAYRNTATYATPTWVEMDNVKDLTRNLDKATADMSRRASGGWRASRATLKDGNVSFQMVYDTADADFAALHDAWLNNTKINFAFADGPIATAGTQYWRAWMDVKTFSITENLEEGVMVNVELVVAVAASGEAPSWNTVS